MGAAVAVMGWNVQAFARGVGPGRLPDLRAHDATTSAQVEFLRQQAPGTTLVLAHDILRQLAFYQPGPPVDLLYSEYVPDFQTVRARTVLPRAPSRWSCWTVRSKWMAGALVRSC